MIPEGGLASESRFAPWLDYNNKPFSPLVDHEMGGVAIGDASQGLRVKLWTVDVHEGMVRVHDGGEQSEPLFPADGIERLGLAFDQNMRPFVAYMQEGVARFFWYDTLAQAFATGEIPGARDVCCCLDDKRELQAQSSDIILAYLRGDKLCYRQQRDRYGIEYVLKDGVGGELRRVGMNTANALQFELEVPA